MANKFIGKKASKATTFMAEALTINKLNINQVIRIQEKTKVLEDAKDEMSGVKILMLVIREGAPELDDITDIDMQDFPMEDLAGLSNEIMEFSGLVPKELPTQTAPSPAITP